MNIGIVAHADKNGAADLVRHLIAEFEAAGLNVLLENGTADLVGLPPEYSIREIGDKVDLITVLGGDGTMLRVAHALQDFTKPLLGINLGSLGFLTCVSSLEADRAVRAIVRGEFVLSPRSLLRVEVERAGGIVATSTVLNDAVISRGSHSRLVNLEVGIDGKTFTNYNADGLILATPTGSTAYSLSAGGPVLMPDSRVFVVTPICPHALTNRSVIVGENSLIEVAPAGEDPQELFLTVDGQKVIDLHRGDVLRAQKAGMELPLVMLPDVDFPELLRQKLKWSGSNI